MTLTPTANIRSGEPSAVHRNLPRRSRGLVDLDLNATRYATAYESSWLLGGGVEKMQVQCILACVAGCFVVAVFVMVGNSTGTWAQCVRWLFVWAFFGYIHALWPTLFQSTPLLDALGMLHPLMSCGYRLMHRMYAYCPRSYNQRGIAPTAAVQASAVRRAEAEVYEAARVPTYISRGALVMRTWLDSTTPEWLRNRPGGPHPADLVRRRRVIYNLAAEGKLVWAVATFLNNIFLPVLATCVVNAVWSAICEAPAAGLGSGSGSSWLGTSWWDYDHRYYSMGRQHDIPSCPAWAPYLFDYIGIVLLASSCAGIYAGLSTSFTDLETMRVLAALHTACYQQVGAVDWTEARENLVAFLKHDSNQGYRTVHAGRILWNVYYGFLPQV
jgi:hypothetical protein